MICDQEATVYVMASATRWFPRTNYISSYDHLVPLPFIATHRVFPNEDSRE